MKIGHESETLEFKKSTGELKEGIISIVAIINKHNSGELYFGVRNDGMVTGQDVSEKTLRDVSQAIANHIEPKIFPRIAQVVINNQNCIHVAFCGEHVPYFAYGRAYLRVADEDKLMPPKELERYILKKNKALEKWDAGVSDCAIDDISENVLKEFLERANIAGRVDYVYTTKRDILNKLGLLVGDKVINAARVLFASPLDLEIQMAIFATMERVTFNDIKRHSGNAFELIEIAEKYVRNNIKWRVELDGSIHRREIPEIPMEAVREALVNSFCHKDYQVSQNNEVAIYKNRIEIYNPGAFPEGLTPDDFIKGSERSIKRNPKIAQLMYYSKDVESFGTGLKRITQSCEAAGVKVDFQMLKAGFMVVFYRSENLMSDKMGDKMSDKKPINKHKADKMSDKKADKMSDKKSDKKRQQYSAMLIEYLQVHEFITNTIAREILKLAAPTVRRILTDMVEKDLIIATGERKTRRYALKKVNGNE